MLLSDYFQAQTCNNNTETCVTPLSDEVSTEVFITYTTPSYSKGNGKQQLPELVIENTKVTQGKKFIKFHMVLDLLKGLSPRCVQNSCDHNSDASRNFGSW
jgi:hypothetical protein